MSPTESEDVFADSETGKPTISPAKRLELLDVARTSIRQGLHAPDPPDFEQIPPDHFLDTPRATFVTLEIESELVGCLGKTNPVYPIGYDVAYNAYGAAFRDPRFSRIEADDLSDLDIHISLLSPLDPLDVSTRAELIASIEPGVHGLLIEQGDHRGTFLPSVWETCPNPDTFLRHLNRKADLPPDYWSSDLDIYRYTVEAFDRHSIEMS